eukprot:6307862-Prymnesium_polylepis.2
MSQDEIDSFPHITAHSSGDRFEQRKLIGTPSPPSLEGVRKSTTMSSCVQNRPDIQKEGWHKGKAHS